MRYVMAALWTKFGRRVFFRRSRLFFCEAAFFSGGEGCEWRAPRATVGESGDKAENGFSGFIPLAVPRKGFSPHIPASRLFVIFHPTNPTNPRIPPIHTSPIRILKNPEFHISRFRPCFRFRFSFSFSFRSFFVPLLEIL